MMEYSYIYQVLQRIQIEQKEPEYHVERWRLQRPAIRYSFKRIRLLARKVRVPEYELARRIVQEVRIELNAVEERISECALKREARAEQANIDTAGRFNPFGGTCLRG
jgi:hypothetical protein